MYSALENRETLNAINVGVLVSYETRLHPQYSLNMSIQNQKYDTSK